MIELPFVKEYGDERARQQRQLNVAEAILIRFGKLSEDARGRLAGITDEAKLEELYGLAVVGPSLEAFVNRLMVEATPFAPVT